MRETRRRFIFGLALFVAAGTLIGWIYGRPATGALVACALALLWQVRQLIALDRALQTGDFGPFRYGDGIWHEVLSRFRHERERGDRRKRDYRNLLKEIRKSTNAMPDGAVILDENNEIVICNRAAKSLAGLKRKKDRGQRVDNILRDPGLTMLLQRNEPERTADIPSPAVDGAWLSCRVVPYGANQKLLLLSDVTERIRINKMRRDFVANASHELRSPLTVISGYLEALGDEAELRSAWHQPVGQMKAQAARMTQIVGELLELSRLEGSGRAPTDAAVDVGEILASVHRAFAGQPDAAVISIENESAAQLLGDRGEIESVVTNLVSNAVRHTPPDGSVTIRWISDTHGADLTVSDTGEGIAEDDIPRLTERFFRVDRGRSRSDGGVGLGLAIVKHVLTRHDGALHIRSAPGAGSEFRCHFPPSRVSVDPPIPLAGGAREP